MTATVPTISAVMHFPPFSLLLADRQLVSALPHADCTDWLELGVDDLDITTDAQGRAAVSAGKYLNERTYLELKQDPETNGAKAAINLDIGRGVKLRGEAGSSGSAGAGIFYEKEY